MSLIIQLKVVPSSGRVAWNLDKAGRLKCYLKSPPEKGKANRELIKILAKVLKMPQENITINAGATSRNKTVEIHSAITSEQLLQKLGIERQISLF